MKGFYEMKRMRPFVVTLALSCTVGNAMAREREDHLEPGSGGFYRQADHEVLFKGLSDKPEIRFHVMPTHGIENVSEIEKEDDTYYIVYRILRYFTATAQERLKTEDRFRATEYKKEIDAESAKLIKSLFDIAVSQSRKPPAFFGHDGTYYCFSTFTVEEGLKSGRAWSPSEGTKIEKLVAIGETLIKFAKSKAEIVTFDETLQKEIESLIERFRAEPVKHDEALQKAFEIAIEELKQGVPQAAPQEGN